MFKKVLALFLISILLTLSLTGCGKQTSEPSQEDKVEIAEQISEEGNKDAQDVKKTESDKTVSNPGKERSNSDTLIVGETEVKGQFLSVYYASSYDKWLVKLMFSALIRKNSEGFWEGDLAEKWDVSEDKKTYTFHMKKMQNSTMELL